jgi:adenylate kinase
VVPGARLAILGKQGAGKGTQAVRLSRHYVVPHIATGDLFRAAVRSGSDFGQKAKAYMDAGDLVPDDVVIGMVRERLDHEDARRRGFLLDGFPRNVAQAEALEEALEPADLDVVVNLDVPTDIVLRRLAGRRVCVECGSNYGVEEGPAEGWSCAACGGRVVQREDDTEAAIARRLALYQEQTDPLIAWYTKRRRLVTVDGVGDRDEVTRRLVDAVDDRLNYQRAARALRTGTWC